MKYHIKNFAMILVSWVVMSACAGMEYKPDASLYERLGGTKAIQAVVNDFVDAVGADKRIKNPAVLAKMDEIDIDQLKIYVSNLVCMAAGGPCEYKGRSMKETHKDLGITEAEFAYVVEDLIQIMDQHKVSEREQIELLGLLAPMKKDIVEVASAR